MTRLLSWIQENVSAFLPMRFNLSKTSRAVPELKGFFNLESVQFMFSSCLIIVWSRIYSELKHACFQKNI